jgi:hypothetical protein
VAATFSIAPDALLRADDDVLDALVDLAEGHRTEQLWSLEVQGLTAELVHALLRLTQQVNAKKGAKPLEPLRLPRPWAVSPSAGARPGPAPRQGRQLSFAQASEWLRRRRGR